jgi:hypothetical protein
MRWFFDQSNLSRKEFDDFEYFWFGPISRDLAIFRAIFVVNGILVMRTMKFLW